jgi:beta-galactosidase
VPHTWQVEAALADYRGIAWYWMSFDAPARWQEYVVRVEFEAVFHTATVWVNGQPAGEHARKGYTAFTLDITHLLHWGRTNTIAVRVGDAPGAAEGRQDCHGPETRRPAGYPVRHGCRS